MSESEWRNPETLHGLYHDDDMTQPEIADRLGTTTSTVSYWMKKHEIGTSHSSYTGTAARGGPEICVMCEENPTPGGSNTGNRACDDCLSESRHRGDGVTLNGN